jgi:hypothetical protein
MDVLSIEEHGDRRRYLAPRPPFPWTAELRQSACTMWLAGFSATDIARHIVNVSGVTSPGLTRCAVMGIVRRAGVYRSAPGPVPRKPRVKLPSVKRRYEGKWA